ncbi:tetratricopeptide repeat protein [Shewanella donghaensis]|uniref:tetratricopeptide repeat protein n=1 Tax=Shewanella donghaensis TaxID=238836 RepID=UPI0011833964|nr:tetratricopeptide repeat protein [Shewanella donghaensis]
MEIYSTEEQQVDAIKQFWKDYGSSIIVGAVVGLGGLYGWNYYSDVKIEKSEAASEAFQGIVANNSDSAAVQAAITEFGAQHDQKGYQALLELMSAKAAVEAGDLDKAEIAFTKIISANPGASLASLATLRLSRVQAEQGNLGTAIATLDQITDEAFNAQRDEFKGDLLVRQGDMDKARSAYQAAVDNGGALTSPALQMKLDNLNKA